MGILDKIKNKLTVPNPAAGPQNPMPVGPGGAPMTGYPPMMQPAPSPFFQPAPPQSGGNMPYFPANPAPNLGFPAPASQNPAGPMPAMDPNINISEPNVSIPQPMVTEPVVAPMEELQPNFQNPTPVNDIPIEEQSLAPQVVFAQDNVADPVVTTPDPVVPEIAVPSNPTQPIEPALDLPTESSPQETSPGEAQPDYNKDWYTAPDSSAPVTPAPTSDFKFDLGDALNTSGSTTNEPMSEIEETIPSITPIQETEDQITDPTKIKIFSKVAFLGVADSAYSDIAKDAAIKLSQKGVKIIFDSKNGTGNDLIEGLKQTGGKGMGILFRPFLSNSSDQPDVIEPSNIVTFVYSNLIERMEFLIKESRMFVFMNLQGLENTSMFLYLLNLANMYGGQNKPIVVVGSEQAEKFNNIIMNLGLTEEQKSLVNFVNDSNSLVSKVEELEKSYSSKDSSVSIEKVIDRRVEGDEKDFLISD